MDITINQTVVSIASAVGLIGSVWLTILKIKKEIKKDKNAHASKILQEAKELDNTLKIKLEARIETLKMELENIKLNVNKDLGHLKEIHEKEIKALANKIEDLRNDLVNQHVQVMGLLQKMIDR